MSRPLAMFSCALAISALAGCLDEPSGATCADLPPDTPGCAADLGPDSGSDRGLDLAPEPEPDADPPPDHDAAPDGAPPIDAAIDPDSGAPDGPLDPPDAGGDCTPGTREPCGLDVGACVPGERLCGVDRLWGECLGATPPGEEACDGLDGDCDGSLDEGCVCGVGGSEPCGSDVGACAPGVRRCVDGAWSACEGGVGPADETCDGVDNDCNGTVDDPPPVVAGMACTVGQGVCRRQGVLVCDLQQPGDPVCNQTPGAAAEELCNGLDDDCDGSSDEAIAARPSRLESDGVRPERRPGIAAVGEFHAAAWIDDQIVYGLALGDAWEIRPTIFDAYNGDDTIPVALSLDGSPAVRGSVMAVAYDGLGSGVDVWWLDSAGRPIGDQHATRGDGSDDVDVAAAGEGFGVAWHEQDRVAGDDRIRFEHVAGARSPAWPLSFSFVGRRLHAPSVAWSGAVYALAWVESAPRSETGDVAIALIDPANQAGAPRRIVLADTGNAGRPDVAWVPGAGRFVVVWSGLDLGRGASIYARFVDPAGRMAGEPIVIGGVDDMVRPAVMPAVRRGDVTEIGVAFEGLRNGSTGIGLRWLRVEAGRWAPTPGTTYFDFGFPRSSGPVAAFAPDGEGYGLIYTVDGENRGPDRAVLLTGDLGCPTSD